MTNQFRNGEWRPTGKQTDRENSQPSGLPATLLLLRCMSPFIGTKRTASMLSCFRTSARSKTIDNAKYKMLVLAGLGRIKNA